MTTTSLLEPSGVVARPATDGYEPVPSCRNAAPDLEVTDDIAPSAHVHRIGSTAHRAAKLPARERLELGMPRR